MVRWHDILDMPWRWQNKWRSRWSNSSCNLAAEGDDALEEAENTAEKMQRFHDILFAQPQLFHGMSPWDFFHLIGLPFDCDLLNENDDLFLASKEIRTISKCLNRLGVSNPNGRQQFNEGMVLDKLQQCHNVCVCLRSCWDSSAFRWEFLDGWLTFMILILNFKSWNVVVLSNPLLLQWDERS